VAGDVAGRVSSTLVVKQAGVTLVNELIKVPMDGYAELTGSYSQSRPGYFMSNVGSAIDISIDTIGQLTGSCTPSNSGPGGVYSESPDCSGNATLNALNTSGLFLSSTDPNISLISS